MRHILLGDISFILTGKHPGFDDVLPFTTSGLSQSKTIRNLHLKTGQAYYATVRGTRNKQRYIAQIYNVWEGRLRKIQVEKRTISRAEWRGEFSLKTGIFRKYPSQI